MGLCLQGSVPMFSQLAYGIKQRKMLKFTQCYCSKASPAGSPAPKTSFLFGYLHPCSLALHTCVSHPVTPQPNHPSPPAAPPSNDKQTKKKPFIYDKYILYFPENGQHRAGDEAGRPHTESRPLLRQLHGRHPRGQAQPRRGPWLPPAGPGATIFSVQFYLSPKKGLPAIASCSN